MADKEDKKAAAERAELAADVERIVRAELAADREARAAYRESEPERQDNNAAVFGALVTTIVRAVREEVRGVVEEAVAEERRRLVVQFDRLLSGLPATGAPGPQRPVEVVNDQSPVEASAGAPAAPQAAPAPPPVVANRLGLPMRAPRNHSAPRG